MRSHVLQARLVTLLSTSTRMEVMYHLMADGTKQQHGQTIFAMPTLSWTDQAAFSTSLSHCWQCSLHRQMIMAGVQVPTFCWRPGAAPGRGSS